jgi:hypothetical protein
MAACKAAIALHEWPKQSGLDFHGNAGAVVSAFTGYHLPAPD